MKIEIPTTCPCCDYKLELVNDQLFCRNTACGAQLTKKVEHFCKTLGIKGMGPKSVEKLDLQDLTELFYLDLETVTTALGSEKTAVKLLDEIERAKGADLATVLASFSITLVGGTASKKICEVVEHIDQITYETCKAAGLGDKVTENLITWLETDFPDLREFLPFSFKSSRNSNTNSNSNNKTICVTGKLSSFKTKAEAYKLLEEAGFTIVESVTKSTDILVDEEDKGSTKRKKAESLGIQIITNLETFLKEKQND
jgi:NAD-dependent DNA ligase